MSLRLCSENGGLRSLTRRRLLGLSGKFGLAFLSAEAFGRRTQAAPATPIHHHPRRKVVGESMDGVIPAHRLDPLIERARAETDRFNHLFAGTEHLLLALARSVRTPVTEDDWLLWRIFGGLGLNPDQVIHTVESMVGVWDDRPPAGIPLTPRAQQAIALAAEEARRLGAVTAGPEHLLPGLLHHDETIHFQVLSALGVDLDRARLEVALGGSEAGPPPLTPGPVPLPAGWGRSILFP